MVLKYALWTSVRQNSTSLIILRSAIAGTYTVLDLVKGGAEFQVHHIGLLESIKFKIKNFLMLLYVYIYISQFKRINFVYMWVIIWLWVVGKKIKT